MESTLRAARGTTGSPVAVPFNPEDPEYWRAGGARLAHRTLWITTAALTLSFATWFVWSAIVVRLPSAGFSLSVNERFWLVALPGLVGATLRIPYAFAVQIAGTRRVVTLATASLLIPAIGIGVAVQAPTTPTWVLFVLAALAGLGGANFSAFMPSTSLFFPKAAQGAALGVQAGLGNLGVSLVQFATPALIGWGALSLGAPQELTTRTGHQAVWLQNAAFFWVIPIGLTTACAATLLRDAPTRASFREQASIFKDRHTWFMTALYIMTFGSFSGFAAATGLLIGEVFGSARFAGAPDPLAYAFLGPLVGSLARPLGGWLSDRAGGARVTLLCALGLVAAAAGLALCSEPASVDDFPLFLGLLLALFFAAGIGNGSTFRMIPILFPAKQAAPVLGWTAAIAAYGAFILPFAFGAALARTGSPAVALWALVGFYLANAALCFFAYARPGASRPC